MNFCLFGCKFAAYDTVHYGLLMERGTSSEPLDQVDSATAEAMPVKDKKKKNIAKDVKEKFAMLRWHGDSSSVSSSKDLKTSMPKLTAEAAISWSKSLDNLLNDKNGLELFRQYLRSEYSEENLEFWIACEDYRTMHDERQLVAQAQKIFTDFVAIQAPREINLDSKTREATAARMSAPDRSTFEIAQKRIQALMAKDSYPRFLRSDVYRHQLEALKVNMNLVSFQHKTT